VTPREGQLVLFPSWLVHTVEPSLWTPSARTTVGQFVDLAGESDNGVASATAGDAKTMAAWQDEVSGVGPVRVSFSCNLHTQRPAEVGRLAAAGLTF